MDLKVELKILDARLPGWGFPHYGSHLAAGLDLHSCLDALLLLRPQAPAVLIYCNAITFCNHIFNMILKIIESPMPIFHYRTNLVWPQGNRLKASGRHQDGLEENFVESGEAAFDADAFFLRGFGALEKVEGDVADGGEVGRSVALSDAALVLAVDDVEHPMEAVLDTPNAGARRGRTRRHRGRSS